jgi:methylenetetrahydrofolate dehydrogenase (NADP+)/methenyltetrahydrofolate cyclohydrolase
MIGAEHIAPGQTVLDIGMNITDEGIIGDVRDGESDETAAARAPVPGGVSAVIPSVLASHVIDAAEKFYREKLNEATIRG